MNEKKNDRFLTEEEYRECLRVSNLILRIELTVFGTFITLFALACAYLKRAEPYPCRLFLWFALSGVFTIAVGQIITRIIYKSGKKSDK